MSTSDLRSATDGDLLAQFKEGRCQRAFDEIVERHGAMVWATARRVLGNEQDAEDAFQATFWALAKAAERLKQTELVAGWLHAAVRHCAMSIRRSNGRRDTRQQRAADLFRQRKEAVADPKIRVANAELVRLLDQELAKLPGKLRTAIVLCDLEGLPQRKAAEQLGLPARTLSDHLTKGRRLLHSRLLRRGVTLSLGGLTTHLAFLCQESPAITASLVAGTTKNATRFAAGRSAAELGVSTAVAKAATAVTITMKTTKIASVLLAVTLLFATGGLVSEASKLWGQETVLVLPSFAEEEEADSALAIAAADGAYRFQEIYDAGEFDALKGPSWLKQWSLRPDVTTPAGLEFRADSVTLSLSVTQVSPDQMSLNFSDNITGDPVEVYSGPWAVTTQSSGPAAGPKDFDIHIDFQKRYRYDPSQGNLLFDWKSTGGPLQLDTFRWPLSEGAAISGVGQNATVAAGVVVGPVPAQLTFVPETSSARLAAVAFVGLFLVRRRSLPLRT